MIEVDPFYLDVLNLVPFLYYLVLILKVYVVYSRPEDSYFAYLNHIQQVGDDCLIAEVDGLKAGEGPKVPYFDLSFVICRYDHWSVLD